jgi:hypothetical protein
MTIAESTEKISAVVRQIQTWPIPMRIALARRILESTEGTAALETPSEAALGYSAKEIQALLKIDQPAADDATVEQWIDEHRMEKYAN